ncbi:universal stress protein [Roseococcus sp. SDR]|uniref:universal stress protein n=1 Tax=Roseococcus sp. SDR TaxID=2835532 RepID=UPI001BCE1F62|nr:universal stress protein [Roseococcus sp. SDR]MBS7791323.1 universal stress protein [Roseococcus sp. SDR]MBV1846637.1 universal stress protein [Roseococcus sp. SDR]
MTVTTIACHVEPGDGATLDASFTTAFALAEAWGAHVTALVFTTDGEASLAAEQGAAAQLRDTAERRGLACEVLDRSSFAFGVGEVFADHLRVSDLGVIAAGMAGVMGTRNLLNAAAFDSGRPLLVVPPDAPLSGLPARVVIAWDATPAAVRAVHGALPFLRHAEETIIVSVTEDKELRAGQSGIALARLLARHGAAARFSAVPRGRGGVLATLEAAAGEAGAEMIVMGAVRHAPLRDIVFGSATRELLDRGARRATLVAG